MRANPVMKTEKAAAGWPKLRRPCFWGMVAQNL
jgi:hypothetical protein